MNILHFIIFFGGGGVMLLFAIDNTLLNKFGKIFGLARGADVLVYGGLILLSYLYIELLNKYTKDKFQLTKLISHLAINDCRHNYKEKIKTYKNQTEKDDFIFNIRVYNEASALSTTIDEVISSWFHKILIINDGSSDNCEDIVSQKQSEYSNALILIASHTINIGGWAANQTWYNFIKKYAETLQVKWFVGFDADGQMDIKDMEIFIKAIHHKHHDLYIWSRFVEGAKTQNMPVMRRIILGIAKVVTTMLYGAQVSDPHNGYRVISIPTLRKFVITADGMHYANEINEQIQEHKMDYQEIPVHIRYTDYSLWKGQKNSNSLKLWREMIYKKIFFR
jgi:polyprenyl-phospho-N-acetylgalactosaminyl synthase